MKSNIYDAINRISTLSYPVIVAFSTGRDSITMLDLMMKYYKGEMKFVYYYFVPNLEYKEKLLRYYEHKYGIEIIRKPSWSTLTYTLGKKIEQGDVMRMTRHDLGISYIALGMRRCESLTRRGILSGIKDIDEKYKYYYPIIEFTEKQVAAYVKMNNLPTGSEYQEGFKHDLSVPDNYGLLYIKNNYPADYQKIIRTFPALEAGIKRIEFYGDK
jgi:phosphoadenosine phosphosulfate reductase